MPGVPDDSSRLAAVSLLWGAFASRTAMSSSMLPVAMFLLLVHFAFDRADRVHSRCRQCVHIRDAEVPSRVVVLNPRLALGRHVRPRAFVCGHTPSGPHHGCGAGRFLRKKPTPALLLQAAAPATLALP